MAPEPYYQEKWSIEQEKAYAEGRKSAKDAAKGSSPSGGGQRKRRIVRTAEGARRYKVPIGSEIGSARNAEAGEAQKDTDSAKRYSALVGQDAAAQAGEMKKLDDNQLQRLAMVAYSWKSSNPDVVRLRIGVANELKRRGFNVNDFGGLGPKSKNPPPKPTVPAAAKEKTKKELRDEEREKARVDREQRKAAALRDRYADTERHRAVNNLSVPQLRQALGVFGKMAPDKRPVVARYLVNQAIELSATHMLGRAVLEESGMQEQVLELAGRWKHGWIPLDPTAVSAKMKGKTGGKQWWSGGAGSGGNNRARSAGLRDRTPVVGTGSDKKGQFSFKSRDDSGSSTRRTTADLLPSGTQAKTEARFRVTKPTKKAAAPKAPTAAEKLAAPPARKPGVKGNLAQSIEAGRVARAAKARRAAKESAPAPEKKLTARASEARTTVVKSSPKPERGSKMSEKNPMDLRTGDVLADGFTVTREPSSPDFRNQVRVWGTETDGSKGTRDLGITRPVQLGEAKPDVAKPTPARPTHIKVAGDAKLARVAKEDGPDAAHARDELAARKAYRAKRTDSAAGTTPREKADAYIEAKGVTGARTRLRTLERAESAGKLTPKQRTELDALKQALGDRSASKYKGLRQGWQERGSAGKA